MARDWSQLSISDIINGRNGQGGRFLVEFARDYQRRYNSSLCISCKGKLEQGIRKFLTQDTMDKGTNSGYVLKKKYEGIQLGFGSQLVLTSINLTDELARRFIEKHPLGEALFEKMPEGKFEDNMDSNDPEVDSRQDGESKDPVTEEGELKEPIEPSTNGKDVIEGKDIEGDIPNKEVDPETAKEGDVGKPPVTDKNKGAKKK